MKTNLEIGQAYTNASFGDRRKLVRVSKEYCYFENLSKELYDDWNYEKDGTFKMSVGYVSSCIENGYLEIYKD